MRLNGLRIRGDEKFVFVGLNDLRVRGNKEFALVGLDDERVRGDKKLALVRLHSVGVGAHEEFVNGIEAGLERLQFGRDEEFTFVELEIDTLENLQGGESSRESDHCKEGDERRTHNLTVEGALDTQNLSFIF